MNGSVHGNETGAFTALVLAGEHASDDPVATAAGVSHKCWAPAAGVPMLVRVVGALAGSRAVGRIVLSIEAAERCQDWPALDDLRRADRLATVACAATPGASVMAAAEALDDPFPLLVTTADHPLLTAEIVDHFCSACREPEADIVAGLTPARLIVSSFPEAQRTYLRFRDGRRSGANLFAILTTAGLRTVDFWRRVEQHRKRPWRIARAFGFWPLLAYLSGRLTVDGAMKRASRVLAVRARAVDIPFAEAAIDVDKPADLALAEQILERREKLGPIDT